MVSGADEGCASDFLLGSGAPDDVVLIDAGRSFTYGELRAAAAGLAGELRARGVPPGSRVGLVGSNSFFWVAAYLASMKAHVVVPLSDKLPAADVAGQATQVRCAAVFVDAAHLRAVAPVLPDDLPLITEDALTTGREPHWPDSAADVDGDAALMFTSGTTSAAKAVRITHRNIRANTTSIISYLGLRTTDRMLVVLPFFYCFGASLLHTHLRAGGSLSLCNSFVFPDTALDRIETDGCTGLAGVPSTFQLLLRASSFKSRELSSLRLVQQAGGKLSPVLVEELVAAKPGVEFFVMYGQTEATARLSYLPPADVLEKSGSIGRGIPGVELRVVDEAGNAVAPGVTGEIVARGDNVSPGYFEDPEASAAKFGGGLLHTGDLAVVDSDGFVYIVDRKDDFIKSWGYRISSQEIEACALQMEDLVSAAAFGVPDLTAGEAITLAVTARAGAACSAEEVLAFTRSHLPKHMVPAAVHLIDAMPLTASGKVAKSQLREMFQRPLEIA